MRRRSLCLIATLVFSFAARVTAQDETDSHSFGCSSTQAESTFSADLNHPSKLQLVPVADEKELERAPAGAFHTIYSKIDSGKYQMSRVDFYIHQQKPKDPENSPSYAPLTIYVKLTSSDQTSWWKITDPNKGPLDESFLSANLPRDGEEPHPPVVILPATGDRTIPLFNVHWGSQGPGVWTSDLEIHALLDLRTMQPKVAADLSCNSITAYGACGVYDAQFQDRNNYECDWVAADDDFHCEATTWNENVSKRQTKSWFQLLSGKEIPFTVPAGNPATLQQFAELAERDVSWRTRQAELPGLGNTSDILRLRMAHNRVVHILGTYGDRKPFNAQFYYVILSKDAPELGYIPSLSLFADPEDTIRHRELEFQRGVAEQQKLPTATNQTVTGTILSFAVKELADQPPTHIYQLTAGEDSNRAVYWLAVDDEQPGDKILFSMTRLASNVGSYSGCAHYRTEDSAAVITRLKARNFRALIDVEPAHTSSEASEGFIPPDPENGEQLDDQCPYSVHVEWNHNEWVTDKAKTHCGPTFSPRQVSIADDGTITAKPAAVESPDSR